MGVFIFVGFMLIGAWLGWAVSMDWSNHPAFQYASYAFVGFWTLAGTVLGAVAGLKVGDFLFHRFGID